MEDFEIDILDETEETEPSQEQLPTNFLSVGSVEREDVKVYIHQDVYKALEKYSAEDTSHERGTILLGSYVPSGDRYYVVISEYIEAKYTDASASTLTFTHETWDYVHKKHEKDYPDCKIIGWQHTHPNYGIFLSNYDMFIQENFFNLPFQIAYVIDPVQGIRGFFQWKDGKVEKLKGFFVYDDNGKPVKIEQTPVRKKEQEKEPEKPSRSNKTLVVLLTVIFALLLMMQFLLIERQKIRIDVLERAVASQETMEETSPFLIPSEETTVPDASQKGNVTFEKYVVKTGDTLYSICKDHNLDMQQNLSIIKSVNGIEDVNRIHVGQIILLPVYQD